MTEPADLEVGLHRRGDAPGVYSVEYRYRPPGSEADQRPGAGQPALAELDPLALGSAEDNPTHYGQELARRLFAAPSALAAFLQARAQALAQGAPLRLRLLVGPTAPELHRIAWETLCDPQDGHALALDENLPLSRYLSSQDPRPLNLPPPGAWRAVTAVANPADLADFSLDPLDVPGQLRRARLGLGDLPSLNLPNPAALHVTLEALLDALRGGAAILYLVCHGTFQKDQPWLWLEDDGGKAARVPGEDFVQRLQGLPAPPALVVLAVCSSAGSGGDQFLSAVGPRLVESGVPVVLAMQGEISIPTVETLIPAFFRELRRDGQVDRALAAARGRALEAGDWWLPVLFSRLQDNRLWTPVPEPPRLAFEPETVYIPAGPFQMGRDPGPGVSPWETPCFRVDLPAYRIGKYPLTNAQYLEFVRATHRLVGPETGWDGQSPPDGTLNHPVLGVTLFDALAYCVWLSSATGRRYTLPNEAQWEKAARGEDGRLYPWGNTWQTGRSNPGPQVTPVDAFPPQSPYGLYDMVGNVREWTLSLWGESRLEPAPRFLYPWAADGRNDPGAPPVVRRVYRGASASDSAVAELAEAATCTARGGYAPDKPGAPGRRHGFRVVLLE